MGPPTCTSLTQVNPLYSIQPTNIGEKIKMAGFNGSDIRARTNPYCSDHHRPSVDF